MSARAARAAIEACEQRRLFAGFPVSQGGRGYDDATAIASLPDGSVVVAGLFSGTADFQPGTSSTTLTARGDSDIYVASYSPRGKLLWLAQLGGNATSSNFLDEERANFLADPSRQGVFISPGPSGSPRNAGEYVNDLAVNADGSVFLVGSFRRQADFDPGSGELLLGADASQGDEFYDAFVVKLDSAGALVWAKQFSGPFDDSAASIAIGATGNLFVGGYFTRQADFNPGRAVERIDALGRDDGYVMRLSTAGKLVWVQTIGSDAAEPQYREAVNDLALDAEGNIYAGGQFAGEARFDRDGSSPLEAVGETDSFLVSYDADGSRRWTQTYGNDELDAITRVAVSGAAVYVGGYFSNTLAVDDVSYSAGDADDEERTDLLLRRFTRDGEGVWTRQLRGSGYELLGELAADANGLTIVGSFFGRADFDPRGGSSDVLESAALAEGADVDDRNSDTRDRSYDGFAWRLSATGREEAADRFGGGFDDFASDLAMGTTRSVLAGRFFGTRITLGTRGMLLDSAVVSSSGNDDLLLAELL